MSNTPIDDDDPGVVFLIAAFGALLSLPIILILLITLWSAYVRTRQWQKEKAQQNHPSLETETLMKDVDGDSESELDPNDSGDEAELKLREEKRRDLNLTTQEYFWKQMGNAWKGDKDVKHKQKAKEREERQKLAKAVAKELMKMERRRNRTVAGGSGEGTVVARLSHSKNLQSEKV